MAWRVAHKPYKGSPSSKRTFGSKEEALKKAKSMRGKSTYRVDVYKVKEY